MTLAVTLLFIYICKNTYVTLYVDPRYVIIYTCVFVMYFTEYLPTVINIQLPQ